MKIQIKSAIIDNLREIQKLNQILCKKEHDEYDSSIISNFSLLPDGKEYFKERIEGKDSCVLIAVVDNKVVGYLVGAIVEKEDYRDIKVLAEEENMFVLEKYRNHGIGNQLMQEFITWCKEKGVEKIRTIASVQNLKGIEFYRREGFEDYNLVLERKV